MLNPFIYFKRNMKRAVMIGVIIALSAFSIYFITTLISSVYETAFDAGVLPFSKFSVAIFIGDTAYNGEQEILNLEDAEECYHVGISSMQISTVLGTTSSYMILSDDKDQLFEIMKKCGISSDVKTDSLQENDLLMHCDLLKNKKKKVGDKMENLKIVGVYDGSVKSTFGLVSRKDFMTMGGSQSYLIIPKQGSLSELNQELDDLSSKKWKVQSYQSALNNLNKDFSTIKLILTIVVVMVSLCIATALSALVYTMYSHRYDEFAILNAIGYSKGHISKMILIEIITISVIATAIGFGFSLAVLTMVNQCIYSKMGQSMQIFSINNCIYTLLLPLLSVICALFSILQRLRSTDLISIIERR